MTSENPSKSTSTIRTITPSGFIGCDDPPDPGLFQRHRRLDAALAEHVPSRERNRAIARERDRSAVARSRLRLGPYRSSRRRSARCLSSVSSRT